MQTTNQTKQTPNDEKMEKKKTLLHSATTSHTTLYVHKENDGMKKENEKSVTK